MKFSLRPRTARPGTVRPEGAACTWAMAVRAAHFAGLFAVVFGVFVGAFSMAGCAGGLLPKPPAAPARYTLDSAAPLAPAPATAAGARSLVVALPTAAPGFDSPRMVWLRQPQALLAYAQHEWVDTPARMLAPLLVRALQSGGAFRVVLQAPSTAAGAWRLETELVRLQHDFATQPSQVRLTLRAVLVDTATRRPLAAREFDARVPATSEDAAGGAAAAAAAARQLLAEVAAFAAAQTAAAVPAAPGD